MAIIPDETPMNDGEWFATPDAQTQEAYDETVKLRQAKPLIRDVIARLNQRIDFYASLESITADIATEPAVYQRIVEANRLCRDNLIAERDYIMQLLAQK